MNMNKYSIKSRREIGIINDKNYDILLLKFFNSNI